MSPATSTAVRLTFAYKDGVIQLVSQTPVQMVLPPSDPLPASRGVQGFWVELQNPVGKGLFRRVMPNPIPVDTEVFTGDPSRPITRTPQAPSEGVFTVVVPQNADAASVVLVSSFHDPAPQLPSARLLATQKIPHAGFQPASNPLEQEARALGRFPLQGK